MGSPKQTAVNLNKTVQKIKDELAPVYGLKNILSAGLLVFSRLSADEQKKVVAEVNRLVKAGQEADEIVSSAEARAAKHKQRQGRRSSKVSG